MKHGEKITVKFTDDKLYRGIVCLKSHRKGRKPTILEIPDEDCVVIKVKGEFKFLPLKNVRPLRELANE